MKVTYKDHMGTDLSVVNAARVSFAKESKWDNEEEWWKFDEDLRLNEKDTRLIKYLAKHNHWTPFGHTAVTLHIKAPLFVARQLGKHQVGLVWNEVSRRYVDDEPEFFEPAGFRARADNVKQGSSNDLVYIGGHLWGLGMLDRLHRLALDTYQDLLDGGVCPEQARMVLPQSMYTEWYWTGSIAAFSRVYNLRVDPHTQKETREVAQQIGDIIEPLFPVSWAALVEGDH